jgi:hypothetical protein
MRITQEEFCQFSKNTGLHKEGHTHKTEKMEDQRALRPPETSPPLQRVHVERAHDSEPSAVSGCQCRGTSAHHEVDHFRIWQDGAPQCRGGRDSLRSWRCKLISARSLRNWGERVFCDRIQVGLQAAFLRNCRGSMSARFSFCSP